MTTIHILHSITDAGPEHAGGVGVSGSHGGLYPAAVASRAGLRAAVFNDAGGGLDGAGVAGLGALDGVGMAAVAVHAASAEIGSGAETLESGVVSTVNEAAAALGARAGMTTREAVEALAGAALPRGALPAAAEARRVVRIGGVEARLLDSASLVGADDAGAVVVTGSHGGLVGGDPARALKAAARFAAFNDAGGGKNGVGFARLPALDARGIAAVTVDCMTARIGDAVSMAETGVISAANDAAAALGAVPGARLADAIARLGPDPRAPRG